MAYDYLKSYINLILVFHLADFYTAITDYNIIVLPRLFS